MSIMQASGNHVEEIVTALIDSAHDKERPVREAILASIFDLGQKQPYIVLTTCLSYLQKHNKLPLPHRILVLRAMERVVKETLEKITLDLATDIIKQASTEMTMSREIQPDWQTAASNVIVALGSRFCNEAMGELMTKFQPGVLPHFFVVQTMANLASVTCYGMVPFLNVVLSQMLHMMGLAKQDNMRWVMSHALCKFSEAILDYVANLEKAPDPSVTKDRFADDIFAAYEILFNVWLSTREVKLRVAIIEAVGQMTHIMHLVKLEEQLPRLIQGMLTMYKKQAEPLPITQGLCMVLDAATADGSHSLETHLDLLMNALFPLVCQPADYANPVTVKNHSELLRCFAVLARVFCDRLLGFLMQKLENNNEKVRIGALAILRHLINAADVYLQDKQSLVLSGLKILLTDPNNKVKKALAQTVMAMSHHDYLVLEGGEIMIEFIIKQCALPCDNPQVRRPTDPDFVSDENLRLMCENVLQLMTTTVEGMDLVLWPDLLEYITPAHYTEAAGTVCRSIAHISVQTKEQRPEEYSLDFEKLVNLPKPPAIMARLMVLAGRATEGRNRGIHVLNAMRGLSTLIHESLVDLWNTVIPKLTQHLQDAQDSDDEWSQRKWEDLLLKMLAKTLDVVDDEDWVCDVGAALSEQTILYDQQPDEKNFLYKCLGVILRKTSKKDFVNRHLDLVFNSVKHTNQVEREGCAICMGFTSAAHLDAVLAKLGSVGRNEGKKASGIFGFFRDSGEGDERLKATLMLCYSYVALYSPSTIIVSRMEATIMRTMLPYFNSAKEVVMKEALIEATDLIGRAMHPDHLKTDYVLKERGDLLKHMQNFVKLDMVSGSLTEVSKQAINACTTLVKLKPLLFMDESKVLVTTVVDAVMSLPSEITEHSKEESYDAFIKQQELLTSMVQAAQGLFREMLITMLNPQGLETIIQEIYPKSMSTGGAARQRALQLMHSLLENYREHIPVGVGGSSSFGILGITLGQLVPRCSDPEVTVREAAIDCVYELLRIELKYQGHTTTEHDQMVSALPTLKERAKRSDPNILFSMVNDLSKVLCKKVPPSQFDTFVTQCMMGLLDIQSHSSSGACVILNAAFKSRGAELQGQVPELLNWLHRQLQNITNTQTKTGTLRAIRTLVGHHMLNCLDILLKYPLPFDENTLEIWHMIGQDTHLTKSIIDQLLERLSHHLPYQEKPDPAKPSDHDRVIKVATELPLTATCVLLEIFRVEESWDAISGNIARLLAACMIRVASTVGAKPPMVTESMTEVKFKGSKSPKKPKQKELPMNPCKVSIDMMQQLLVRAQLHDLNDTLTTQGTWDMLESEEEYPEGFTQLARTLVQIQPAMVASITSQINPVLMGLYDSQRIMAAAFFSELIAQNCDGNEMLVEMMINTLLGRLVDSNSTVRKLCIRGLGNIACSGQEQLQRFSTTVLSAMMAGMDDKDDPEDEITLEAMSGLSQIIAEIDEGHVRAILINISLRIRPCFEKEKGAVRAAAFQLFGKLSKFGDGPSKEPFLEQVHSNFISLLLHLNDAETDVRKACKFALRQIGPLIGSEAVNQMFQKHLLEDASLHYGEFMNDLSKAMITDFIDKMNFYAMGCVTFFKSAYEEIRGNAAMFLGFLLGNMPPEKYASLSKEHICNALILLLKDSSTDVRVKAAEAMSQLHAF